MKTITLGLLALGVLLHDRPNVWAQPVPHHISGITIFPDKTIALHIEGSVSNMFKLTGTISNRFMQAFDLYPVETSTDLVNWTRLGLLLRTNNDPDPLLFTDGRVGGLSQRFYRTFTNHLITFFPKPTGPFAVGAIDRVLIDPARTNLYRYAPRTNAFMITFWYPTDPPKAGALPGPMWDKRVAADANFYADFGLDRNWAQIFSVAVPHRVVGLPLAAGLARYPVLLYSNGLPGHRKALSQQCEELASHGYVVAVVDHSDCWATEFPDGRYLIGNHSGDIPGRLKDMTFLLNELTRMDSTDPLFAGRLDLERVGGFGQSYGGTVVETCRADTRMKCVGIWDASLQSLGSAGLQKPILVALGESSSFYAEDLRLFDNATNGAVFLQIKGANHDSNWDSAWTVYAPGGRTRALAINACFLWFFDKYLKGKDSPFPTNPEIYNIKRK
jgi:dienelactone hydrolase